ncbi:MAG: hypothetical protein IT569_00720, partial [Leptospiraceae bacterium]|nr:hypothetical protein [Leptospiraceae bacterium]
KDKAIHCDENVRITDEEEWEEFIMERRFDIVINRLKPDIAKIGFHSSFMVVDLKDGRKIKYPLSQLPQIKKLSPANRKKITLTSATTDKRINSFFFEGGKNIFRISDRDLTVKACRAIPGRADKSAAKW